MSLTERGVETPRGPRSSVRRSGAALFAIDVSARPGETVLTLRGELDTSAQPVFASALANTEESVARIVLDLSDLTFIDCGNIGLIHDTRVAAGLRGVQLELQSPNAHLLRIFELTGLIPRGSSGRVQHRVVLPSPARVQRAAN